MADFTREKSDKGLEERDGVFFKGKLRGERARRHARLLESQVLFAVSASSVCLRYEKE